MAIEKRTFATSEKAKAAMDELVSQGFSDVEASFTPDRVQVAVNAPFGEGQRVAQILDRHGPLASVDKEEGAKDAAARTFDCAALASSAAPLSDFFGWSVLKDYKSPFWPESLVDDPTPLSNKMGWSVLSVLKEGSKVKNLATPLSDSFGWSVLSDYKSPFWPEALIDDPTPLSNKFGWSVLSGPSNRTGPRAAAAVPVQAPGPAAVSVVEAISAPLAVAASPVEAIPEPAAVAASPVEDVPAAGAGEPSHDEPPPAGQTKEKERKRGRRSGRK